MKQLGPLALGLAMVGACHGTSRHDQPAPDAVPSVGPTSDEAALRVSPGPGVHVALAVAPYPVHATTGAGIAKEMMQAGPIAQGRRYPGATEWHLRWTHALEPHATRCALRDVRTTIEVRVHLPRWEPASTPDAVVVDGWTDFRTRLVAHEREHVRIAVEAGGAIVQALRPLTDQSCDTLRARANQLGDALLAQARERERRLDLETDHGTKPAAVPQ